MQRNHTRFDGKLRFDLVLEPRQQARIEPKTSNSYSGLAAVCGVKFIAISGFRPDNRAIKYMSRRAPLSRSGSYLCRAPNFIYPIAFPYPRLMALVRRRCFRSKWHTDEADAALTNSFPNLDVAMRTLCSPSLGAAFDLHKLGDIAGQPLLPPLFLASS